MTEPAHGTRGQTPEERLRLTPTPTFAPGDPVPGLSSWVLERKLGGGGFGEVWLVRHAFDSEQRPRAVKFCTHPSFRHQLIAHERNVVVRVMKYAGKHPNILPLLECNLDGDIPWLMYEFVEGGTLADLIERWRELPLPNRLARAVRVLHALARALATCHRLDPALVHRDLKPQNVLMDGSVPRVTDFGIGSVALESHGGTPAPTALAACMPSALSCTGTRMYAPPEQMFGAAPSPRDDVYSLGVIAYQSVTGDLRTGPGPDATGELRGLNVPGRLASLIVRSVSLNPARRPKDGSEWETTLEDLLARARANVAPPGAGCEESLAERQSAQTSAVCDPPRAPRARAPRRYEPESGRGRLIVWEAGAALANRVLTVGFFVYFLFTSRDPETASEPNGA